MHLAELSAAERTFLLAQDTTINASAILDDASSNPSAVSDDARQAIADGVADGLGKRLGAVLSARLKLQVNPHLRNRAPSQSEDASAIFDDARQTDASAIFDDARQTDASAILDNARQTAPRLHWDGVLDVWWLNRRLGGRMGSAGAVSPALRKSLARTLERALAETWLSLPFNPPMPATLAWRMEAAGQTANLEIHFPPDGTTMKRWAQARIREIE
jgi:hypothetical protein